MIDVIFFYNLVCGIFCNVLVLIFYVGFEFCIVEYLKMLFGCDEICVLVVVSG